MIALRPSETLIRYFAMTNSRRASKITTTIRNTNDPDLKLIPWSDIWTSLKAAKCRGHGDMIGVFYDTLFKEATFDDKGAWSVRIRK